MVPGNGPSVSVTRLDMESRLEPMREVAVEMTLLPPLLAIVLLAMLWALLCTALLTAAAMFWCWNLKVVILVHFSTL